MSENETTSWEQRMAAKKARKRERAIAEGRFIEYIEHMPEGFGTELLQNLKEAIIDNNDEIIPILQKIGNTIHGLCNINQPAQVRLEGRNEYTIYLSSGTAGTRVFLKHPYGTDKRLLTFPNVGAFKYHNDTISLAGAFEELFIDQIEDSQLDKPKPNYELEIT